MRKSLLILAFLIVMSCAQKSSKEIAKENFENYIERYLHDSDSYEFVSMSEFDTLYMKDFLADLKKINVNHINKLDSAIVQNESTIKKYKKFRNNNKAKSLLKNLDSLNIVIKESIEKSKIKIDSIDRVDSSGIESINSIFTFRANNAIGAKTLHSVKVIFNDSLKVKTYKTLE